MMIVLKIVFLLIGMVLGTRIGLLGVAMFCYTVGLMYVLIKLPTHFYKMLAQPLYDVMSAGTANLVSMAVIFVFVLIGAIELGWQMLKRDALLELPPGVDHALGGAVGGAIGWVMISLIFG